MDNGFWYSTRTIFKDVVSKLEVQNEETNIAVEYFEISSSEVIPDSIRVRLQSWAIIVIKFRDCEI